MQDKDQSHPYFLPSTLSRPGGSVELSDSLPSHLEPRLRPLEIPMRPSLKTFSLLALPALTTLALTVACGGSGGSSTTS